jgi:hypothetical protein
MEGLTGDLRNIIPKYSKAFHNQFNAPVEKELASMRSSLCLCVQILPPLALFSSRCKCREDKFVEGIKENAS